MIKDVGEITDSKKSNQSLIFYCRSKLTDSLSYGDSIAVNGVCQTVLDKEKDNFIFQTIHETIQGTNLRFLQKGSKVNLEPPLTLNTPLNGHIVQGHVDFYFPIQELNINREPYYIKIRLRNEDKNYIIHKGSISIDGISLTIQEIKNLVIQAGLIKHTVENTRLKYLHPGDYVNVEFDLIGKYIINKNTEQKDNNLFSKLNNYGFINQGENSWQTE